MLILFIISAVLFIFYLVLATLSSLFSVFGDYGLFTTVTSLPFGWDETLQQFVGYVHGLITAMPFLAIIWQGILLYGLIAFTLWVVNLILGLIFNRRV